MPRHDYSNRTYKVTPYDPEWPDKFERIKKNIAPIFGEFCVSTEHIGSTAIPGMAGKPTIDVLITMQDVGAADSLNEKMAALGYSALGEYVSSGSRLFALESDGNRLANIHCYPIDHPKVRRFLAFRDYLRSHHDEAAAYAQLKLDLYNKFPADYNAYRQHKDAYVQELEEKIQSKE